MRIPTVGELKERANDLDVRMAYKAICKNTLSALQGDAAASMAQVLQSKESLYLRPLEILLSEPHIMAGWLSVNRDCYTLIDGKISWNENPIGLLL